MSSNNIKWAFNLFRSSSNTFKQSSLIFYGDQEILPLKDLDANDLFFQESFIKVLKEHSS